MGRSTPGSAGGQVTAANTALHHIATLLKANDALNKAGNTSSLPIINKLTGTVLHQGGQPAVNNWNQAVHFVSEEVAKLIKGGVANESEINAMIGQLSASNSPEQRNAAIKQLAEFMHGRLAAIEQHRDDVLGPMASGAPILSKEAQRVYDATQRLNMPSDGSNRTLRYNPATGRIE